MTGLTDEQLADLVELVHDRCADRFVWRGRPLALGLCRSVAMVVFLMRKNATQDVAGAVFDVAQPTVSRRWDLLRPVIGDVLARMVPAPGELVGRGTVVVGTVCPTWDWSHAPDLFSAKVGYPGMNLQIAATIDGVLIAVGPRPVHGARHDAHAFAASGLAAVLAEYSTVADLGYVGVDGIDVVPFKPSVEISIRVNATSTAHSAKPGAASNTPSRTLRPGGYSAKKVAAIGHREQLVQRRGCGYPPANAGQPVPIRRMPRSTSPGTGDAPVPDTGTGLGR